MQLLVDILVQYGKNVPDRLIHAVHQQGPEAAFISSKANFLNDMAKLMK